MAYVDFGIWGKLDRDERRSLLSVLVGFVARDPSSVLKSLRKLGVKVPDDSVATLTAEIGAIMDAAAGKRLGELSLGLVGREVMAAVRRAGVTFPHKYALLVKGLITIEGSARLLHEHFDLELAAVEYLKGWAGRNMAPSQYLEAIWRNSMVEAATRLAPGSVVNEAHAT